MPKISIIVPCYNASAWIDNIMESILLQSERDFEIILVNDGSRDNTAELCHKWRCKDSRIKYIEKNNGGVSSARNAGLEIASGDWIMFADVDDCLKKRCLETLLSHTDENVDVVFAGYTKIGGENNFIQPKLKTKKLTNEELAIELFSSSDFPYIGYPWGKLFRRDYIQKHNLRFDETISYNEDRLFIFAYLSFIKSGVYTTESVYDYLEHEGNAMAAIEGPGYVKFETDLDAFVEMNKIAPKFKNQAIRKLVWNGAIGSYVWNKRLNKYYGDNSESFNKRIRRKLFAIVPIGLLIKHGLHLAKIKIVSGCRI